MSRSAPSVAYLRGEHGAMPPLWPDHENFLQATLYEKVRFLPFSSKNCKIQQCLMVFWPRVTNLSLDHCILNYIYAYYFIIIVDI